MNPLRALEEYQQAIWLDFVARGFIETGELEKLVTEDGIRGVTSNPAIFEKAIAGSEEYDNAIKALLTASDRSVSDLYEGLAVEDIQRAADVLRPVFDATGGEDGFVSLEVSPYLAMNPKETVAEGRRLWAMVKRDNLMIKVPGTEPGLQAIHDLIGDGINVNVTLLFSQKTYERVVEAYLSGLEKLEYKGGDLSKVASVASFFISRIDASVEKILDEKIAAATKPAQKKILEALKGTVAIANAKLAYQKYTSLFSGARWTHLAHNGARPQRLLWASTGTKNKAYSDVLYIDELIGPNTVNTVPPATLDAFRDHGKPSNTLQKGVLRAEQTIQDLSMAGISLDAVTDQLVIEGVRLFSDAADSLLGAISRKRTSFLRARLNEQQCKLGTALTTSVAEALEDWRSNGKIRQLWAGDSSLWSGADESNWLGWLRSVENALTKLDEYRNFAKEVRDEGLTHAVLLGMGGSSLGPEVLADTFGNPPGWPKLIVLDSTDPAQINSVEAAVDMKKTLFIVSSKSGSTIEPNVLMAHFLERVSQLVGRKNAGRQFVAVTDPGSQLEKFARQNSFWRVFLGEPTIGGRYSVLSPFGLVPAAAAGHDVAAILDGAQAMIRSCGPDVPPSENPGVQLGLALAAARRAGRDKVTISSSPEFASFGAWAEQLIAESTGKNGNALIPLADEPIGTPDLYGSDRIFIDLRTSSTGSQSDAALDALEKAGHPVIRILVKSNEELGQEFFRFELATAVAGSAMSLNPFDQPDVEDSKSKARDLTTAYETTGSLPSDSPVASDDRFAIYADPGYAKQLGLGSDKPLTAWLEAHFKQVQPGDYFAILAYVERNQANAATLQSARIAIRDRLHVATCLGFGPRFLHSTGQAYKGGPNTGVFLQVTVDDQRDVPIPGRKSTFGVIKASQAQADLNVLAQRKRRALSIHLKGDTESGLAELRDAVIRAVS